MTCLGSKRPRVCSRYSKKMSSFSCSFCSFWSLMLRSLSLKVAGGGGVFSGRVRLALLVRASCSRRGSLLALGLLLFIVDIKIIINFLTKLSFWGV